MTRRHAMPGLALGLGALVLSACLTLDPFIYNPVEVDEYDWDADPCDPLLEGELAPFIELYTGEDTPLCHPSIVPEESRREGFIELDDREVHYVFAHHGEVRDTIFYSHGTGRHIGRYWDRVEVLWEAGYNVMIYDYPQYGRSTGETLNESTVYGNGEAALDLTVTFSEVDPQRLYFYGYSLGGGPTMELALRGIRGDGPAPTAIITEAIFCSIEALVQDGSGLNWPGEFLANDVYDNCGKLEKISGEAPDLPVMIMHGDVDDFVLPTHAELLRERANDDLIYRRIDRGEHSNLPVIEGLESYLGWLRDVTGEPTAG